MKKILTSFVSMLICGLSSFAQTEDQVTLVLDIDNVNHVVVDKFGEEITGLVSGVNTLTVSPWTSINIAAKDGYTLQSVVNAAGEEQTITKQKTCSVFIGEEDETLKVTTAEVSNVNFTIIVDDASVVSISDATWSRVSITDGTNKMSLSATQLPLGISSTTWQPFYKVTLDDEEVPYNWGYSVNPSEGSVINIQTKYPDVDFNVTFDYVDETNSDFFCGVYVNSEPVDFANGFSAKAGSKIELFFNTNLWYGTQEDNDYPLTVNLNGEVFQWFGSGSSFILSRDTEIQVAEASRKEAIEVQLTVDNVNALIVYSGSESNRDIIKMQPGANTIKVGADEAHIVIETAADEYKILSASVNDEDLDVPYYNYLDITRLKQGDKIAVTTNKPMSGITEVTASESDVTVYSLSGVRLLNNVSASQLYKLPAGIYIVNGKKIVVK